MSDKNKTASPAFTICDGRVLYHARPTPAIRSLVPLGQPMREPSRLVGSLADNDSLLIKARFVVTNDADGATAVHNLQIDRQQLGRLSSTALVMVLGRLSGHLDSGNIFFVRGNLELSDRSTVAFLETSIVKRHVATAHMVTVEALLV